MYSIQWFETFATTVSDSVNRSDLAGIVTACPRESYPRLLELGCGTGRIAGPLANLGYRVVGLDINLNALIIAQREAPGPQYITLDQVHVGKMRWQFDGALILWNSLGFVDKRADLETLKGIADILRPGGRLVLDLYHPGWLKRNQQAGYQDPRGAVIDRWLQGSRCFHHISYPDGSVDQIAFNVYVPDEMQVLAGQAGLSPQSLMVRWDSALTPSADYARYELVCVRPNELDFE